MRSFILLTFLFLGLGFYELSGGSDFEPEVRPTAAADPVDTSPLATPDMVTRDDPDTLADVSVLPGVPEQIARPLIAEAPGAAEVEAAEEAVAAAIAAALTEPPAPVEVAVEPEEPVFVSLATPQGDERFVDATSLNVRSGPSTNDQVVTRLEQNAAVTVLSELDDGWALIRVAADGTEGWVASRFLSR